MITNETSKEIIFFIKYTFREGSNTVDQLRRFFRGIWGKKKELVNGIYIDTKNKDLPVVIITALPPATVVFATSLVSFKERFQLRIHQ